MRRSLGTLFVVLPIYKALFLHETLIHMSINWLNNDLSIFMLIYLYLLLWDCENPPEILFAHGFLHAYTLLAQSFEYNYVSCVDWSLVELLTGVCVWKCLNRKKRQHLGIQRQSKFWTLLCIKKMWKCIFSHTVNKSMFG